MEKKKIAITGATSGIGKATTHKLLAQGHQLFLLIRSLEKGERMLAEWKLDTQHVTLIHCDLADLNSVQKAAGELKSKMDTLDVLLNNAGGIFPERYESAQGLEYTFAMNHLGHFYLTLQLLPLLEKAEEARIVNVSSEAHKAAKFDLDDLQLTRKYAPMQAYGNAKLFNIYFANGLAECLQEKGITANSLHPGVVNTNFGEAFKGGWKVLLKLMKPFMIGPNKGAETSVYLATSPKVKGVTGKYFKNKKPVKPSALAQNQEMQRDIWKISEEILQEKSFTV